ncbi:MAG TPA: hypothetical protein PLX89_26430 [Verrucomicrobiota bacterium]|nr:hypothetical protein [Verrucomicrobiota bacterium]
MGFLVDTNLWIAVERGDLSTADVHAITRQQPVYLSPINDAELRFGIGLMAVERGKQRALAMLRKALLRITNETAEVFGDLAAQLELAGRGADFRIQDLWLAVYIHR